MNVIYLKDRKEEIEHMIDALYKGIDKIPHLTCGEAHFITSVYSIKETNGAPSDAHSVSTIKELYNTHKEYLQGEKYGSV